MEVQSLIGCHVFDVNTEKYQGKIIQPIIDYEAQQVLGFVFRKAFYYPYKAFAFSAIKKSHKDFLLIEKEKAGLFLRQRTLRKAYKKQRRVITLKLVEGEKQVGKVFDFVVNEKTGKIKTLLAEKSLFSDIFKVPVSKVKKFDLDAFILEEEAIPQEQKEQAGLLSRAITSASRTIGTVAKQGKRYYGQGQKNLLLGQESPCDISGKKSRVLVKKGQTITEELLKKLEEEQKLGELSAAIIGSGMGAKYKSYKDKKKKKALKEKPQDKQV